MSNCKMLLLVAAVLAASSVQTAQATAQTRTASPDLPAFAAATFKPPDPGARYAKAGFYGEPGGRIFFGGNIRMLVETAFNLQDYQVAGGPDWTASQWFEINAVPPEASPSRNIKLRNAEPTSEQRLMLQSLLRDRFGFKFHLETKEGDVYILTRGSKPLQLNSPKDTTFTPSAIVIMKQGSDARRWGSGGDEHEHRLSCPLRLSRYLQLPVLKTKPELLAHTTTTCRPMILRTTTWSLPLHDVVDRLGLKIKRARGPVQTLVIDHIEQPSEELGLSEVPRKQEFWR